MIVGLSTYSKNIFTKGVDFQDEDDKFIGGIVTHKNDVRNNVDAFCFELKSRADVHDNSKMQDPECSGYKEMYKELDGVQYMSPEYVAIRDRYKDVIEHHYQENDHHPEHFPAGIKGMNLFQIVEMYCDWKAACKRDDGDFLKSIEKNIIKFGIPDQFAEVLMNTAKYDLGINMEN